VKFLKPGPVAAMSVALGAVAGFITNVITSRWNWTLAVALLVIVIINAVLAWFGSSTRSSKTAVREIARGNSRIIHGTTYASKGAQVNEVARKHGTISDSSIEAFGGNVDRVADDSRIEGRKTVSEQ
jgi:hypothetical protein